MLFAIKSLILAANENRKNTQKLSSLTSFSSCQIAKRLDLSLTWRVFRKSSCLFVPSVFISFICHCLHTGFQPKWDSFNYDDINSYLIKTMLIPAVHLTSSSEEPPDENSKHDPSLNEWCTGERFSILLSPKIPGSLNRLILNNNNN